MSQRGLLPPQNTHVCTANACRWECMCRRAGEREGEMNPGSSRKSIVKINKWIPSSMLGAPNDSISFLAPLLFHSAPLWGSNATHTPQDGSAEGMTGPRASVCQEPERRVLDGLNKPKLAECDALVQGHWNCTLYFRSLCLVIFIVQCYFVPDI